jgi:formamidopyrimidine-DNA glycosylase
MPELPEIHHLAGQMAKELEGKVVADVEVRQEKCLNVPVSEFKRLVNGKKVGPVTPKGKWIFVNLEPDAYFLLSLGMGGNLLYHKPGAALPDKYQLAFTFDDGSHLSVGFWWFGYAHAVRDLAAHKMTAKLGVSPIDDALTYERFVGILKSKKGTIKSVILDQAVLAGIGNVYAQDILFKARLHPDRKVPTLTDKEKKALYAAMREYLKKAVELGGIAPEKDLYGNPGGLAVADFLVGYREGKPCPACGATIEKIKTGSTASYVCPKCQR